MNGGFPSKYCLCIIHSHSYIYNFPALTFYAYQFIYKYHVFSRTSILEIIIYISLPCILTYINCCNNTMFFFAYSVVVYYYIQFFCTFNYSCLYPLQYHKTSKQRIHLPKDIHHTNRAGRGSSVIHDEG